MAQNPTKYPQWIAVVLALTLIVTGCETQIKKILRVMKSDVHHNLEGVWEDTSTHARHTIQENGGTLIVSSIVDDDGEVYEVLSHQWEDGVLRWSYLVPSTGYVVHITTQNVQGNTLSCTWSNPYGSGTQDFRRVK